MLSCETPMTVAPSFSKSGIASAKLCASIGAARRERRGVEREHDGALFHRVSKGELELLAAHGSGRGELGALAPTVRDAKAGDHQKGDQPANASNSPLST
jgi:hypothetical protein